MSTGVGMSSCCLSGKIQNGQPKGREETIGGIETYVSEPEDGSKKKTIIFLVDIFGWKFNNTRLLADQYAAQGFYVYIPDVHSGDSLPISFLSTVEPPLPEREARSLIDKAAATAQTGATLGPWLIRHREAVARPVIEGFIRTVRLIPGTNKVGTVGFCWGGRYALLAGHKDFSFGDGRGVDAVYSLHPSLVAVAADFEDICVPTLIGVGDKDSLLGMDQVKQIQDVMEKKREKEGVEADVRVYEDQIHGWSLRGDFSSEKDKQAMDRAEKEGFEFFEKHLSGN